MFAALRTSAAVRCGSFGSPNAASADIRARRACLYSSTPACLDARALCRSAKAHAIAPADRAIGSRSRTQQHRPPRANSKRMSWARGSCERYGRIIPAPYKRPYSRAAGLGCWQLQPQGVAPVSPWEHDSGSLPWRYAAFHRDPMGAARFLHLQLLRNHRARAPVMHSLRALPHDHSRVWTALERGASVGTGAWHFVQES